MSVTLSGGYNNRVREQTLRAHWMRMSPADETGLLLEVAKLTQTRVYRGRVVLHPRVVGPAEPTLLNFHGKAPMANRIRTRSAIAVLHDRRETRCEVLLGSTVYIQRRSSQRSEQNVLFRLGFSLGFCSARFSHRVMR
jgi:hypothetical protein